MRKYLYLLTAAILLPGSLPGMAQTFEYSVTHRHLLRDCRGTLVITPGGVDYRTADKKDQRQWKWENIRAFEVKSPSEISIVTYEDQKRWVGKDKIFEFTLIDKTASPELAAFLLSHVKRPMELSILPGEEEEPAFEIPVKHLRTITGTQGVLQIYSDRVVYRTAARGDSRVWRILDIERFSQPDRFRFEIVSYLPKAGGPTENYNFQLFEDLPAGLYDYLWVRLHKSSYYPQIQ